MNDFIERKPYSIFAFIAGCVLHDLNCGRHRFCDAVIVRDRFYYEWTGTARLFAFMCWYVTELGELNGLKMYKGKHGQINIQGFSSAFINPPTVDRKLFNDFSMGINIPKGAEIVKKIIEKNLQNHINKPIKKLY